MSSLSSQASLFIKPPLHVLEVLGNAIVGGMETWVVRMVERLPAERFRVSVVCPFESALTERLRAMGLSVYILPMPNELAWNAVNQLRVLVESHRVDLLHAHLPNAHLLAGVAGRLAGRPVLTTVHGRQISLADLEMHRAVASHLSVVCRHTYLHALGLGVTPDHLTCDPNGVDTNIFSPRRSRGTLRRNLKLPPSALLVGFVGRLSMEKGPEVLVRAALLLRQALPDAHVVFVGEGPCRATLEAQIASLDLCPWVHLLGVREDMPALYSELDVLASTSYSEAMPLAIMEAMACGLPVVATRVGGVPDMVQHGHTGWLVAPGDYEDLARMLVALLLDGGLRQAMGTAARRHAMNHWQLDACVARLGGLLERLSGSRTALHHAQDPRDRDSLENAADTAGFLAPQPGAALNRAGTPFAANGVHHLPEEP